MGGERRLRHRAGQGGRLARAWIETSSSAGWVWPCAALHVMCKRVFCGNLAGRVGTASPPALYSFWREFECDLICGRGASSRAPPLTLALTLALTLTLTQVTMPPSATVAELKAQLQPRTGVSCAHQRLMYKRVLSDGDAALASAGVRAGAKLMLMGQATLPVTVAADGGAVALSAQQPVATATATPSQLMAELAAERRARHGGGACVPGLTRLSLSRKRIGGAAALRDVT